jgi:hypothetical protein
MVLLVGLLLVGFLLVDLLRRCIFLVRAFFRLVVLSTRMVRELNGPFHLRLVGLAGQVLWPGIMPRHLSRICRDPPQDARNQTRFGT